MIVSDIKRYTDFRLMLHNNIYNEVNINVLINYLNQQFELFNAEYNDNEKKIELKIKKTNIKKINNYSHSSTFYYSMINTAFLSFLRDPQISSQIRNILNSNNNEFYSVYQEFNTNPNNLSTLYNLSAILDNVIIIYL